MDSYDKMMMYMFMEEEVNVAADEEEHFMIDTRRSSSARRGGEGLSQKWRVKVREKEFEAKTVIGGPCHALH
jgi:hypothetical protein